MNTRTLIATALFTVVAGSAFAQEGTQDFPSADLLSSRSRAEVRAELLDALRAGALNDRSEASAAPVAASMLLRAQVVAETREAVRLGVVGANDAEVRVATPAQAALIRAAGLRALDRNVADATR